MYEMLYEIRPYSNDDMNDCSLFNLGFKVMNGYRPTLLLMISLNDSEKKYVELMKRCWHQDQENRPSFHEIYDEIEQIIKLI